MNPDTANSDTANSDTANPDTANSDTANSDTANSDTANSDTANSDTANPDTANSDTANSDTANSDTANSAQITHFLARPEGRIGYDVAGNGPLVVLVPGMGDLRSTYRFVAPILRDSGLRVACTDLRGHGDSDATFASYGDIETAADVIALIEELGCPAVVVGNSMAAGAGALVAAERPELVAGLVLIGPFVRNPEMGALKRTLLRMVMAPMWAAASWKSYMPKLYAGRRPVDFDEYRAKVVMSLRRPGYAKAFSLTSRTNHDPAQARLADVAAPTMVIMGDRDPDFPDPASEASWIAGALNGGALNDEALNGGALKGGALRTEALRTEALRAEVVMVHEAGHYPQSQQPEITADAVLRFVKAVNRIA